MSDNASQPASLYPASAASSGIFCRAKNTVIEGGQFVNIHKGDAHFHGGANNGNRSLELLYQNVATGAFHDAAERGDLPKCYPQTRSAILAEIQHWVRNAELREKLIMWIYGPAGSGKSAIVQTIAEIFAKEKLLVASFFFSRTGIWRNDTSRFIASIAYQLYISIPGLSDHVAIAVEQDPHVFARTLLSQMQALIIKPLNDAVGEITQTTVAQPRLVIIDGLDEARGEMTHKELLQALATAIQQLHIPLIFLVASRPEHVIRQTFNMDPLQSLTQGLPLDEHYKPDHDIRIFLSGTFSEIKTQHPSGNALPVPWPSEEDIDYLVRKASGQFIYAATVMKYIASPRRNPTKQLQIICGLADPGNDTPFAQLDSLYDHILSSVEDITRVLEILTILFLHSDYVNYKSVDYIETLLGYDPGDVAAALIDMHALVEVSSGLLAKRDESDKNKYLSLYHASLQDFLMDKSRSGHYFLDATLRHTDLARRLLRYITVASEKEYKEEQQFSAILTGFVNHYLQVPHTEELVTDLKNFSLTSVLSNIPMDTFYFTKWDAFFDHLKIECSETNTDLYRQLRDEFDNWIRNQYQQYPEFIQHHISAACAILGNHQHIIKFLPDIFNILTRILPPSDVIHLWKLDKKLFQFRDISRMRFARPSTLVNFFTNSTRAGVYFADQVKFGELVKEIVKVLCRSGDDRIQIVLERHVYGSDNDSDPVESKWPSTLKINVTGLDFFPMILAKAPEDPKLARLLWELAVQYKNDDPISKGRKRMADSSLEYINKCGIFVPKHKHQADCSICANYKPAFPAPSPEPEEITQYMISTPDEPTASRSDPPSSPQHMARKTPTGSPVATEFASPSSPTHFPNVTRSPTTTTRDRAAVLSPSATRRLSNSPSTSSFALGAPSRNSIRPSSAEPSASISATHRLPNRPSATSRAQPSNAPPSNSPLSTYSPSASKAAQASTSSLPQPKAKPAQSVQQTSTKGKGKNTSKKPTWKM